MLVYLYLQIKFALESSSVEWKEHPLWPPHVLDVYLQCDLRLINLHLLPGLINTYSAYLPDWRGELKGKPKLLTQHPVYKAMVSVAYKLPLSKANAGMTPSPTFLVKLWWVGFLGATISLLLSILIYNFYMVKCTNTQYTT